MAENENSKPDAEQYARVVLWHLCTIESQLMLLKSDIITREGQEAGASVGEILEATQHHGRQIRKHAEPLYRDALAQANIKPSPTFPPDQKK